MRKTTSAGPRLPGLMTLLLFAVWAAAPAWAADDARALLQRAEQLHRSSTQEYAGELTVVAKTGKTRHKGWKSYREGYAGDAKNLIRFVDPPEVKGVGYLSIARTDKHADQWLYLPSMKRERRIASQDRDSSFVGTDFNYEDLEEFDHTKYRVTQQDDQVLDGQPCVVIEALPRVREGDSVYEKKILFLRRDLLYLVREDLFRRGGKTPEKRLEFSNLQHIDGHWVARTMTMTDLVKGSTTTILLQSVAFDRPQPPDRFTLQNLNREGGD